MKSFIRGYEIIEKIGEKGFSPLPFLQSGYAQTVASAYWPYFPDFLPSEFNDVSLGDGDSLRIVETRSGKWKNGHRIILVVHGLAGDHQSNYMTRIARHLFKNGVNVIRVNLRGCGVGGGLAKNPYHSGRSEDIRAILKFIEKKYPQSLVTLAGYSLGANITLKLAGEDGKNPTGRLDSFVAVSPPVNLSKTAAKITKAQNRIFDQFFIWRLKKDISRLHKKFPDLRRPKFPLIMSLIDFDDLYTAPRSGFKNAQDYYSQSSSEQFVPNIKIPGLILCAMDDPIVETQSVANLKTPEQVDLVVTKKGGHVGFLGSESTFGNYQWMDSVVFKWIQKGHWL